MDVAAVSQILRQIEFCSAESVCPTQPDDGFHASLFPTTTEYFQPQRKCSLSLPIETTHQSFRSPNADSESLCTEETLADALAATLISAGAVQSILHRTPKKPSAPPKASRSTPSPRTVRSRMIKKHTTATTSTATATAAAAASLHSHSYTSPTKTVHSCNNHTHDCHEHAETHSDNPSTEVQVHKPHPEVNHRKQAIVDDERQYHGLVQRSTMCMSCHRKRQTQDLFRLSKCFHVHCIACLRTFVRETLRKGSFGEMRCPLVCCASLIDHMDMKMFLSASDFDAFMATTLNSLISTDSHFFRCPNKTCGVVMEKIDVDLNALPPEGSVLNAEGKPLSKELIIHRAENRFRCPTCSTEFCAGCSVAPYHLGFSCQDYRAYANAQHCRFCSVALPATNELQTSNRVICIGKRRVKTSVLVDVCTSEECLEKLVHACPKTHPCGHRCIGVRGEKECPPCLHENCAPKGSVLSSDFCNICWTEELCQSPALRLSCGHYFHLSCIKRKISDKWSGARITFNFLGCPLCNKQISHALLSDELRPHLQLLEEVKQKAYTRLLFERLDKVPDILDENGRFFNDPMNYALDRFCYYNCNICQRVYFGGQRQCDQNDEMNQNFDPKELVCGGCCLPENVLPCIEHGTEYMEYKCCFCCNLATWFCWGRTHFCNDCHDRQQRGDFLTGKPKSALPKCLGPSKCKLKVRHPPNGEEFALGCAVCRIKQSF